MCVCVCARARVLRVSTFEPLVYVMQWNGRGWVTVSYSGELRHCFDLNVSERLINLLLTIPTGCEDQRPCAWILC